METRTDNFDTTVQRGEKHQEKKKKKMSKTKKKKDKKLARCTIDKD